MPCVIKDATEDSANPIPVDVNNLPGPHPTLSSADVHVWHADLDTYPADGFLPLLSEDEVSRARRFHFSKDRNHFIVARGLLRKLLGDYLNIEPARLRFAYAEKGKPALEDSQRSLLSFNLAHSHGKAIYAFSRGRAVGVDLEFVREDVAGDKIAERFFSPFEIAALKALTPELREQAFFDCWTRKEAYIKARGDGLSMPLDEFDVSLAPGEEAALLQNPKEPEEVRRWTMRTITVAPGYVAALVVEGDDFRLQTFQLDLIAG
jgi:4'-phosphopantetheinyl transferase